MPALSCTSLIRILLLAGSVSPPIAGLAAGPASPPAHERPAPGGPAALPPPRPEGLTQAAPRGDAGTTASDPVVLPPERPAELKPAGTAAAPTASGSGAMAPPLPPERPSGLTEQSEDAATKAALPTPPTRPAELSAAPPPSPSAEHGAPLPPDRPAGLLPEGESPTEPAPLPPGRPADLSGEGAEAAILAAPEDSACLSRLEVLGVRYTKVPAILKGQCSVGHPLSLRSIAPGDGVEPVALGADQIVVCGVAEGLALWVGDVRAAAEAELGDRLSGLTLGGGYVCRAQNHVGEAKLSEHAFANAIDVMGFTFAKRAPIAVGIPSENSPEARFLDSVRASACRHFRTVLGPGSNETHANHLHFDQRARTGDHRLCELRPNASDALSATAKP